MRKKYIIPTILFEPIEHDNIMKHSGHDNGNHYDKWKDKKKGNDIDFDNDAEFELEFWEE